MLLTESELGRSSRLNETNGFLLIYLRLSGKVLTEGDRE